MFIGAILNLKRLFQTLPLPVNGNQKIVFTAGKLTGLRMEEPSLVLEKTCYSLDLSAVMPMNFSLILSYPLLWLILRDAPAVRLYASPETGTLVIDAGEVLWAFTSGGGGRSYLTRQGARLAVATAEASTGTVILHSVDCIEVIGRGFVLDAFSPEFYSERNLPEWTRKEVYAT